MVGPSNSAAHDEGQRYPVIVLAGGKGTRLGRDKASEVLAGKPLLQHVLDACAPLASRYVIVTARGQGLPHVEAEAPMTTVEDAYQETGPLGGIYTGLVGLFPDADDISAPVSPPLRERGEPALSLSEGGWGERSALVLACDMPLLQPPLLRQLLRLAPGHDAVAPVKDGLPEPLCAVYTTACLEPARELLERGAYKLSGLLDAVDTLLVPQAEWRPFDPEGLSFLNVNRQADLEHARALIERHEC